MIVRLVIPISSNVRLMNLLIIVFYAIMGVVTYFISAHLIGLIKNVFDNNMIRSIKKIIIKK